MKTYANENDPSAAHWLSRIPIHIDHIDDRSIKDVEGKGLDGFTQCHFFAGIGGWPLAFKMAGWPTDVPVWSGSCPCQPFSAAGKRKGTADERHLWPEFLRLIAECNPPTIFGEQVASKAGREWLATVRTDLEALGYAVGAADLCAASVGAPHIRQRLFWVADSTSERGRGWAADTEESAGRASVEVGSGNDGLAYRERERLEGSERSQRPEMLDKNGGLGNAHEQHGERFARGISATQAGEHGSRQRLDGRLPVGPEYAGQGVGAFWSDCDWLPCRDGKARPAKPGIRCLDDGIRGGMVIRRTRIENGVEIEEEKTYSRVAALKGFGNAIVPQVAATFIAAFMESREIQVTA